MDDAYASLADALGIAPGFHTIDGHYEATREDSVRALAEALGHPAGTPAEAAHSLGALRAARAARLIQDFQIARAGAPLALDLPSTQRWSLRDCESGALLETGSGPMIAPAGLPAGRYRLAFPDRDEAGSLLLVRPARVPLEDWISSDRRGWGVMAALYGLRSERNPGLGDFSDLAELAALCGGAGADFLGINPIHALRTGDPGWYSPYSPNHRGFWNTAHIALDAVPELAASPEARRLLAAAAPALAPLRVAEQVDHGAVSALREPILAALFTGFEALPAEAPRRQAFERWRRAQGEPLERFATFEAIADRYGSVAARWPAGFAHCGDRAVAAFAAVGARSITFHAWLQFLADEQIATVARRSREAGMGLGLYLDVAVGTVNGSAEVWTAPEAFARGVSIGAPPDHFNPTGQSWDLAPFHPHRLMDADCAPLVAVLRAAMRHAGMIRIDHVLGLKRSFWVPDNGTPGCYVHYPFEALLALLAIEADRAGAVVVGEDLGLVPEDFRPCLQRERILGCTVMQFERNAQAFTDPGHYRSLSIGSIGSHDVPPLKGWWQGVDIEGLLAAGLIDTTGADQMRGSRAAARAALWRLLGEHGLLPPDAEPARPPEALEDAGVRAAHALLARSPVVFAALQLDDMLGVREQQNIPGTVAQHPNWRRRQAVALEALAAHAGWLAHSSLLAELRPR